MSPPDVYAVSGQPRAPDVPVAIPRTKRIRTRPRRAASVRSVATACFVTLLTVLGAETIGSRAPVASAADSACATLLAKAGTAIEGAQKTGDAPRIHEALGLLDRAAKLCPEEIEIPFLEGLCYLLLRKLDETLAAKERVEKLVKARSIELNRPESDALNDPHVLYIQALVHIQFGTRPGDAATTLRLLRNRDPNFHREDVLRWLFISLLQFSAQLVQNDDLENALRQASMAQALARGNEMRWDEARHRVAQILSASNRWAESQPILEDLAKRHPLDTRVCYDLAGVYAEQLHFDQAIDAWRETIRLLALPDVDRRTRDLLSDAKMRLGNCLVQSGKLDDGKKVLEEY